MNRTRLLKQLIGFALISLIMVGCGGAVVEPTITPTILPSPTPTITPSPTPTITPSPMPTIPPSPTPLSPEAILESAVAAMKELESYHFEMILLMTISSEGTTTEVPLTFIGDFKMPDRLWGELTMEMFGQTIRTELINIGGTTYMMDPLSGEWQISTESATPFTPEDFVGLEPDDIINMEDLTLLGEEDLDGEFAYLITGKLPTDLLPVALGEFEGEIKVEYWIGVEDGWVRLANVNMELFRGGDVPQELNVTASFKFSDYNKEVIIEAP